MEATNNHVALNPTQLHLLKMFYFAKRVEDEMDALWESGEWNQEKNEAILKEHLRTSYGK